MCSSCSGGSPSEWGSTSTPACRHAVRTISSLDVSSVWHVASEDSNQLRPGFPSIHRRHDLSDVHKSVACEMPSCDDKVYARDKLGEVVSLRGAQLSLLKERYHYFQQITASANDITVQMLRVVVRAPVDQHLTHSKELTQLVEAVDATRALGHHKFVKHLIPGLVAAALRTFGLAYEAD